MGNHFPDMIRKPFDFLLYVICVHHTVFHCLQIPVLSAPFHLRLTRIVEVNVLRPHKAQTQKPGHSAWLLYGYPADVRNRCKDFWDSYNAHPHPVSAGYLFEIRIRDDGFALKTSFPDTES